MGYSCTARADETMKEITDSFESKSNFWIDSKGQEFFFEIGRENNDGSITGSVIGKRIESFKIASNGDIIRFPHIPKGIKKIIMDKQTKFNDNIQKEVDDYMMKTYGKIF